MPSNTALLEHMAIAAVYVGDLLASECDEAWFRDLDSRLAWQRALAQEQAQQVPFVGALAQQADPQLAASVMEWMSDYWNSAASVAVMRQSLLDELHQATQQRELSQLAAEWPQMDGAQAETRLRQIQRRRGQRGHEDWTMRAALKEFYEQTSAAMDGETPPVVRTGYYALDRILLGGFFPGDVILIGARTSVGKSAVALNFARRMAVPTDGMGSKRVLFVSLEMSRRDVITRLLGPYLGADTRLLRLGDFRQREDIAEKLARAVGVMSEWPLRIWDAPGLTLARIDARVRQLQATEGLDCVMIDYVQLLHRPRVQNTAEELSAVAEDLKTLAKAWGVPVVVMSQINRQAEQTNNHAPDLWQLKGSGGLEESADVVMLLHRPLEERHADGSGPLLVRVAKQRNGPTDTVPLWFDAPSQHLRDREG